MEMTSEQLDHLMHDKYATVEVCYHGIGMSHECPERGSGDVPVFVIRIVGHLLNGLEECDPASDEIVSDHKLFSVDIPFHPEILASMTSRLSEVVIQAIGCESLSRSDQGITPDMFPTVKMSPKDVAWYLDWINRQRRGNGGN